MTPLRIIFAGTAQFVVPALLALLASEHQVVAVYTPPDRPAGRGLKVTASVIKQVAERYQLPLYQPASLADEEAQSTLRALQADVMVVAVYGLLIPQVVLTMPRFGCINIHPSLLPRWRGAAPIPRCLAAGDSVTGVTIMQLDAGWDTGDILLQETYPLTGSETSQDLYDALAPLSANLLLKTLTALQEGTLHPIPQDGREAIYAEKLAKAEAELDWQQPAFILERYVRAFNPWPVVYSHWQNQVIRIWRAQALADVKTNELPGTVVAANKKGIDIAAGDGSILRVLCLQVPGSKPMSAADFLHARGRILTQEAVNKEIWGCAESAV